MSHGKGSSRDQARSDEIAEDLIISFKLLMHLVPATQGIVSGMSDDGMFA